MEEIVNKLKQARIDAGLSVYDLAHRMGVEPARLYEIERGRGGLTLKRMLAIADALGLEVTIKFEKV